MSFQKIIAVDAEITARMRVAEKPGILRTISSFLAHSGDSWYWFAGLPVLWLLGNEFWKDWSVLMFASIFLTASLVMALKFTIRRRRPEGEWGQIYRKTDPHSFPSGHAARGMLIALVALGFSPGLVGTILLVWGPLVGIGRIAMGVHYVSDVVAGWMVGALMAALCLNYLPALILQL